MEILRETGTTNADAAGRGAGFDWCDVGDAMRSPALVGESAAVRRMRSQVERIGPYFRTAVLTGEEGTGKEMVAQALRGFSRWASGPFVVCDARVEDVGEVLRTAEGGVLFLDHLGEMTPPAQARFVRALEDWSEARMTSGEDRRLPVRIVAATHRDLRTMTISGRFRQDLYGRIAVVEIAVPALRARLEDMGAIAQAMARRAGSGARVSEAAVQVLREYAWPGNLDELQVVLARALVLANGGPVEAGHVHLSGAGGRQAGVAEGEAENDAGGEAKRNAKDEAKSESRIERLEAVIERHVLEVLTLCGGNKLRTAELLGISRSTLYRMLESALQSSLQPSGGGRGAAALG